MSATLYTVIIPTDPKLPAGLVTRLTVQRADGGEFSREELEALVAAYPPPAEAHTNVKHAVAAAKPATAKKAPKAPARPRKAAKRPV